MTITLADFIQVSQSVSPGRVEFVGKLTWPELRRAVIIEFENDPDTKIFLQPGHDDFDRVSCWKAVVDA